MIDRGQILKRIFVEAKNYKERLANTSLLLLYKDKQGNLIKSLEIEFKPSHFQHLTGLLFKDVITGEPREHVASLLSTIYKK